MERDIKQFVLKALLAANDEPYPDATLRSVTRAGFPRTAITVGDLSQWIDELQVQGFIAGTRDGVEGLVWMLTPKGKISAQRIPQ
jgi:DNA-binding PadR family transcriptional regulator